MKRKHGNRRSAKRARRESIRGYKARERWWTRRVAEGARV